MQVSCAHSQQMQMHTCHNIVIPHHIYLSAFLCSHETWYVQAAYTFDAGPNAVIYVRADHLDATLAALLHSFQPPAAEYQQ
jgi:mevalonate pyrophosphate decarboxylase